MIRVLLVLGNGFDLSIGCKTSYNDYFSSIEYKDIRNEVEIISRRPSPQIVGTDITCWDILFCEISKQRDIDLTNWCDIEEEIKSSLDTKNNISGKISWLKEIKHIHNYIKSYKTNTYLKEFDKSSSIRIALELYCNTKG